MTLQQTCAHLAPAVDLDLFVETAGIKTKVVAANDWNTLPQPELLQRLYPFTFHNDNMKHFEDRLHLTDISNSEGIRIGRCAILTGYRGKTAVGITKGIMAGYIDGMTGIIHSTPQTDLARNSAVPAITKDQLQTWAEEQKSILCKIDMLDMAMSRALAWFGASHAQLLIGSLGNHDITQQELFEYLRKVHKFAVHDGEIEHDGDDDVKESEFDQFHPNGNVLALTSGGFFEIAPSWIEELPETGVDTSTWALKKAFLAALNAAWGSDEHWSMTRAFFPVGKVDSFRIDRFCDVYQRPPQSN